MKRTASEERYQKTIELVIAPAFNYIVESFKKFDGLFGRSILAGEIPNHIPEPHGIMIDFKYESMLYYYVEQEDGFNYLVLEYGDKKSRFKFEVDDLNITDIIYFAEYFIEKYLPVTYKVKKDMNLKQN